MNGASIPEQPIGDEVLPIDGAEQQTQPAADIGPGSLLWQYGGDWRMGLTGLSAGILQLMHPAVGAGVLEHSRVFKEPWARAMRSIPEIIGVIYDPDGEATGARIRGYHTNIKGVDSEGRAYSALEPETFWWAHATFHGMVENIIDRFDARILSPQDREQLYQETNTWYRRYGVSDEPVPKNYPAFKEKWNDICDNTLEMTPAARWLVDMVSHDKVDRMPNIPPLAWKMLGRLATNELIRVTAIGGLPENVRERFDIPWSHADKRKLDALEVNTQLFWPLVPSRFRYHPRARAGMKYAKQQGRV